MSPQLLRFGLASALLALAPPLSIAAESANAAEIKRVTDRYNLTQARIHALLDQRLHPIALPANPPNPFYRAPAVAPAPGRSEAAVAETPFTPEAADLSDIDTLRKYAAQLRIGGVIVRNGVPHVTINNVPCKAGDIITVGSKDRPIYVKVVQVAPGELELGLNEAKLLIPLKK